MKHRSADPNYRRGFAAGKRAAKRELRRLMERATPVTHVDLPKPGEAPVKAEGGVTIYDLRREIGELLAANRWAGR